MRKLGPEMFYLKTLSYIAELEMINAGGGRIARRR